MGSRGRGWAQGLGGHPSPHSLRLQGPPLSVHFPGDICSSSLRPPEESWSNRSPLFKSPQNFQTMRLLSLSSLGWPSPKREGSQEVEEVIKPFYIHAVFNCFHSRGRKKSESFLHNLSMWESSSGREPHVDRAAVGLHVLFSSPVSEPRQSLP